MAGKGGGAWKVAYADFVTAMMAFFLVMWITAQQPEVKEAIADHFSQPLGWPRPKSRFRPGRIPTQRPMAATGTPPEKPSERVKTKKVSPFDASAAIYFAENEVELDDKAQQDLDRLLPELSGKLQKIEVRGHTSRRPLPSGSPYHSQWEICFARCVSTLKYLQEHGIEPERIRIGLAGGFEPQTSQTVGVGPDRNARVEIYLLSEFVRSTTD